MKGSQKNSQAYVFVCVIIDLSYLPSSHFYKDYIFFKCDLNNMFMVGSVLLLIGSHCEGVLSFYTFTPL